MSDEITDLLREQLERSSRERDHLQRRFVESLDNQGQQHAASINALGDRMERAMSAYPVAMTQLGDRLERSLSTSTEALREDIRHTSRVFGGLLIVAILVIAAVAGVGVKEHLGGVISLTEIQVIDSQLGEKRALSSYFSSGKPVLLNLVYFECPMLCTMVLNGVNEGLKKLAWSVGKEFDVVT
ncbi:hypothetical protein EBU60_05600, partial [bacterium]|nr:hypothetical protein [bacterium]